MSLLRAGKPCLRTLAALAAVTFVALPYYVRAQRGHPVPGRIVTLTPYFLLQGEVSSGNGALVTVKTANYGPGLSREAGIHSHAIALGRSYQVDLSRVKFQAVDGTAVANQGLRVGDKVVMLVNSTPNSPQRVGGTTTFNYTAYEVIRNDQTP